METVTQSTKNNRSFSGLIHSFSVNTPVSIAPLAVFRVLFGLITLAGVIRFAALGWIDTQYLVPDFHFTYYGFGWVKPLPALWLYVVFGLMALSALFVALGLFYRIAAATFFLTFTYVELLDKAYYLNHYYFVSIMAFLMIWLPAHRYFSLDALRKPHLKTAFIARWPILLVQLQISILYVYAGFAKINDDWLIEAMPLRLWLPPHAHLPIIGPLLALPLTAYIFSWAGMLYDLTIPFWLLNKRTRPYAYFFVIIFHGMTALLFPIGMFPWVMTLLTLIFFSARFHQKIIYVIKRTVGCCTKYSEAKPSSHHISFNKSIAPLSKLALWFFVFFMIIQLLLPWRYLAYSGSLFWREEGYRFSWRVMLMEKAGYATFYVKNPETGREGEVINADFLNDFQEKQMATQPDMILQFAHFLARHYQKPGQPLPQVRAEVYATLNGKTGQLLIDPHRNLTDEKESFAQKDWLLPRPK